MPAPVRPLFQNGQRLTADRLTLALEFLRSWIRRLSLGPLSAGVGAGLTLQPFGDGRGLIVNPGIAIDGRGRLLLLPEPVQFTPDQLASAVGVVGPGTVIRVRLVMLDGGASLDPCTDQSPTVSEDVDILLDRAELPIVTPNNPSFSTALNCVSPNDPLDLDVGTDCSVTLGHVLGDTNGVLSTLYAARQGVSPELGVLRNSLGTPSVSLGQFSIEFDGLNELVEGVAIPRPTLFTERTRFIGRAAFERAGGADVQATRVSPVGVPYAAGSTWGGDGRIFTFPGGAGTFTSGSSDQPAGRGGICAVPCQKGGGLTISAAGMPLDLDSPSGLITRVKTSETSSHTSHALIGLSASKEVVIDGITVVPIATAGLVKVTVVIRDTAVVLGHPLTVDFEDSSRLRPAVAGEYVLARACVPVSANTTDGFGNQIVTTNSMLAWVVHPPVLF